MPRHGLEQLERAGYRERQDEPVRLREAQRALRGRGGCALVPEPAVRERREPVSLHDGHIPDGRRCPGQDVSYGGESAGWVAFGEAEGLAGIADLAVSGPF